MGRIKVSVKEATKLLLALGLGVNQRLLAAPSGWRPTEMSNWGELTFRKLMLLPIGSFKNICSPSEDILKLTSD